MTPRFSGSHLSHDSACPRVEFYPWHRAWGFRDSVLACLRVGKTFWWSCRSGLLSINPSYANTASGSERWAQLLISFGTSAEKYNQREAAIGDGKPSRTSEFHTFLGCSSAALKRSLNELPWSVWVLFLLNHLWATIGRFVFQARCIYYFLECLCDYLLEVLPNCSGASPLALLARVKKL